jgi:hypothetical protein
MILEGWHHAVLSGRYAGVRYDCASESVARWISVLARNVWLSGRSLLVAAQMGAQEIAALPPAAAEDEQPVGGQQPAGDIRRLGQGEAQATTVRAREPTEPLSAEREITEGPLRPQRESAEDVGARKRRYQEIFGPPESEGRWRWRR